MSKFLGFGLLYYLFGSPFIAIIVLLIILYIVDRMFIGLSPSLVRPFRRMQRSSKLKQELHVNPHNTSAKQELAHLLLERGRYMEARKWLEPLQDRMENSAEYWDDLGTSYMHTGDVAKGEAAIVRALELNPRVKYGQPYLRLAKHFANHDKEKSLTALQQFGTIHSSSCEMYYRMGLIYAEMGRKQDAKQAWQEAIQIYRTLPKYMKRKERSWVVKSRLKLMIG